MNNSNIDVDIIDETLLYVCINGKREHISVENARIKYAKNAQLLSMIDEVLTKYKENTEPTEEIKENNVETPEINNNFSGSKDIDTESIEEIEIDLGDFKDELVEISEDVITIENEQPTKQDTILSDNDKKLDEAKEEILGDTTTVSTDIPFVDESKFATIYDKYSSKIKATFLTDSPSFLDVEKLTLEKKTPEQVK